MVRERGSKQMRQVKIGDEAGEQIEDDKDKRGEGVWMGGGGEDKQHRRKKVQVRHLVSP